MATNFIQPGSVLDYTAPVGGVTSGAPVLIGDMLVIPSITAVAAAKFAGQVDGVWNLAKPAGAISEGAVLYWDDAAKKVTTTATGNRKVGTCAKAALNGDAKVWTRLDGIAAEAATEAAAGAAVAAAVAVTNGGAGNSGKLIKLDGNGKLAGRVIETDGATLDGLAGVTAAGAVRLGDYSAQSVLVAVADDTPNAVALAAKQLIGRGGTGDAGAKSASVTLDPAAPAIDGATETTAPAGGILGRLVFGSWSLTAEVGNGASVQAQIETAPASGVFKDSVEAKVDAGAAINVRHPFAFMVPPGCKYKFAKTVAGASAADFTTDGYNFADL